MASVNANANANKNVIKHYINMRENLTDKFHEQLSNPENLKVADKTYGNMMKRYESAKSAHSPTAIGETPAEGSEEFLTMFPPRVPTKRPRITQGGKGKSKRKGKGSSKTKRSKTKKNNTK
jgi:hypothetical protein